MFIEADAYISLEQLGNTIQPPFPYVDEVPLLSIQVQINDALLLCIYNNVEPQRRCSM